MKNISEKYETIIKSLSKVIMGKDKRSEKLIIDIEELRTMLQKYAIETNIINIL